MPVTKNVVLGAVLGFALCLLVSMLWSWLIVVLFGHTGREEPLAIAMGVLLLLAQITGSIILWRRWRRAAIGVVVYIGCEVTWILAAWLLFPHA